MARNKYFSKKFIINPSPIIRQVFSYLQTLSFHTHLPKMTVLSEASNIYVQTIYFTRSVSCNPRKQKPLPY